MVSAKFYSDYDETDVYESVWAEEGQVTMERLKQLEISFLNAIQWNIFVSETEFYEKLKTVERLLAMKEGMARGWFTYSELEKLLPTIEIAKQLLHYTSIIMFSYVCSIMTFALSSVILANIPAMSTNLAELRTSSSEVNTLLPEANQTKTTTTTTLIVDELTDDCTFDAYGLDDEDAGNSRFCNFTIGFPFFLHDNDEDEAVDGGDNVRKWELMTKNYQDFPLAIAPKFNPVPMFWA